MRLLPSLVQRSLLHYDLATDPYTFRNGKQAMLAGAFDDRITAVVSSSSGSPGTAISGDYSP